MKHIIADTNVFLRFLTNDIPAQAQQIEKRFKQAEQRKFIIVILHITIIEILFHLEKWYKLSKKDAVEKVVQIITPSWIEIGSKDAILEALGIYAEKSIDFVDLITWMVAKSKDAKILSFDKHFDKLTPKIRLKP